MKDGCTDTLTHRFFETFDKMAEERQEPCIYCGKVWYAIHHKDGVCHNCQKERKPGRIILERRNRVVGYIMYAILAILQIAIVGYLLS